ncbi:MAG: glycerol-3-phosphate O-acyltransferase/dihydroxyacetone phosphate acyltransferase [Cognaticolwellia sp.]|jgi:glycerol-3-phosphate O-acyltransferase/dihydroxyacetone phosphate acyltransferase
MSILRDNVLLTLRVVLGSFFRSIRVQGLENVPQDRGGILVSWHVSGVIDPALLVNSFPREVVFGARHGLLKIPLIGTVLKEMDTVPIYRAEDLKDLSPEQRREQNAGSLDALADAVAKGKFAALFPEGDTHDNPYLSPIKSGAARFYYRARQLQRIHPETEKAPSPVILPVGLFYDNKTLWRSDVLVVFHPPMELPEHLDFDPAPQATPEELIEPARELRDLIEARLNASVHATESWELHRLMQRSASVVRAERAKRAGASADRASFQERVEGVGRIWEGHRVLREQNPKALDALLERMGRYDGDLEALGLDDSDLDQAPGLFSPSMVSLLLLQLAGLVLVMPPLLIIGLVVNGPATMIGWAVTKKFSRSPRDDATVKIMVGTLTYPLSWLAAGLGAWHFAGWVQGHVDGMPDTAWLVGLLVGVLSLLGGMAMLRYVRGLRETWRSLRVRLTRARAKVALIRLKVERSELYELLMLAQEQLEVKDNSP